MKKHNTLKRKLKQTLSLLLAILLIATALPISNVYADEDVYYSDPYSYATGTVRQTAGGGGDFEGGGKFDHWEMKTVYLGTYTKTETQDKEETHYYIIK